MYRPDIRRYQQLPEPITGRFDCGAYMAAVEADADTKGKILLTGRQVRLATDERIPDKISPGLNLRQTDDALVLLTGGKVNLDTHFNATWSLTEAKIREGRFAHLCVIRGPLVDAGFGGGDRFRGAHGVVAAFDPDREKLILGDPLVPFWQDVTWAALERAADLFTSEAGRIVVAFTRIVNGATPAPTVRYSVKFTRQSFFAYEVNASLKVVDREARKFTKPTSARSTSKRAYDWPGHGGNRELARINAGTLKGLYVEPGASGLVLAAA